MRHFFGTGALLFLQSVSAWAQPSGGVTACVATPMGQRLGSATVSVQGTLLVLHTPPSGCVQLPAPEPHQLLRVRRVGYRPLDLEISGAMIRDDTLRLVMQPSVTELAPTLVNGAGSAPLVVSINAETLRQLPALGERDVFRALPFAPGVSQPNDVLSRVHLAGGASDEHGITLDGHPLQAPFHLNQVFGAVNPSALERVDVKMHHLPASHPDRISGSIDLTSRRPDSTSVREVHVSVLSAGVTALRPMALGVADLGVSVRSSYLDGLLRALNVSDANGGDDLRVPSFRDAMITVGRGFSNGWRIDALGFHTEDRWFNSSGVAGRLPPTWGSTCWAFAHRTRAAHGERTSGRRMIARLPSRNEAV